MDRFLEAPQRISRAKREGCEAFGDLYDWLVTPIYRYAWNQVNDQSAAEDICAEAFLALVNELDTLPESDLAVMAWMRRVVRNKSVDWIRRKRVQRKAQTVIADSKTDRDDENSPSFAMETQEECHLVQRVLHRLPSDHRDALELCYIDGLTIRQVATALDLSVSAANSLLFRARENFRKECDRQQQCTGEPSAASPRQQGAG
jgi:RNA polymerase sigma-70 factor (ECF subfamily)